MSRDDLVRSAPSDTSLPVDRRVDRRAFIGHLAGFTAVAGLGSLDAVWRAAPAAAAAPTDLVLPDLATDATHPWQMTLAEAAAALRRGEISAVELAEGYLDRIRRFDPVLRAFAELRAEGLLEAARLADLQPRPGALHGIPLAIKDNWFTAGIPTRANSYVFEDFVPTWDAEAWARLKGAGALLVGKTEMGPLATSRATTPDGEVTTVNAWAPFDPGISPGGSSSGSATSVAAGLAAGATGTQTGGSITNPALAQGLTGLKPTMGRVSLRGIIPLTYTRDHPGPLAKDALDAAILLRAMAGPDPADPRTLGLPAVPDLVTAATPVSRGGGVRLRWPTRVGVTPGWLDGPSGGRPESPGADADTEARERHERALARWAMQNVEASARSEMLARFRDLGAEVVEVELPEDWGTLTSGAFNNVRLPERAEPFMEALRTDVRQFGVSLSPWINGLLLPGAEYLRGQRAKLLLLRRILDDLFAQCDVVVQESPIPFDIVGLPEIAFPIGMIEGAGPVRPVGAILGGQPFAEDRLLSLAGAYQAVTDWHRRRPADPEMEGEVGGGSGRRAPRPRLDLETVMEVCE